MTRFVTHTAAFVLFTMALALPTSAQWKEATIPAPFNSGYYLDVFFMPGNPNLGWACSIEGFVVRTTDGGTVWRGASVPNANLEYVQFLTPQIGYASGPSGVYRSDDGGANWRWMCLRTPSVLSNNGWWWLMVCVFWIRAFERTQ
ncbi:MAG: hypothetical protein NTX15_07675 [Candidatus Kapabacteria bacterium]|nr:hypothetical protein [Candidatus Kapabacteria bacterium]